MITVETSLRKLKSVMLIDDNEIDNFISQKYFEHYCKSDVIIFTSALDALDYLRQTPNLPDLILLDLNLPIMNGLDFLDELEKLELQISTDNVIILSVSINPRDLEIIKHKKYGQRYMEKPLKLENIMKLCEQKENIEPLSIK
jgi:CheY-like chemotaxis protein